MSRHVRKSDLRGCVEVSAEFIAAMVNFGQKPPKAEKKKAQPKGRKITTRRK